MKPLKLYSYVVTHDTGFAPNPGYTDKDGKVQGPNGEWCTLACCKPDTRRLAKENDWVIGIGSVMHNEQDKLVYAMKIKKSIRFEEYAQDPRFKHRVDNIYFLDGNPRNNIGKHTEKNMERDVVRGKYVLISNEFYYFGKKAKKIDTSLRSKMIKAKGRKHKVTSDESYIKKFEKWLEEKTNGKKGILGKPHKDPTDGDINQIETCKYAEKQNPKESGKC